MFYEPKEGHGLPNNPLNALVVPRPIGWISTISKEGTPNLAPYSFFNAVARSAPGHVCRNQRPFPGRAQGLRTER